MVKCGSTPGPRYSSTKWSRFPIQHVDLVLYTFDLPLFAEGERWIGKDYRRPLFPASRHTGRIKGGLIKLLRELMYTALLLI